MLDREMLGALPYALRVEIEENVTRKDFTQSELAEIQRSIITHWAAVRKQRQGERTDLRTSTQTAVEVGKPKRSENTTEQVARLFGESEHTTRKRLAIVAAAAAEPERFGKLQAEMDRTGRLDAAYKQLTVARARDHYAQRRSPGGAVTDLVALAASGYRATAILADPPWPFHTWSERGKIWTSVDNHYDPMTLDQIKALPVAKLAADNSELFLWSIWPLVALGIIADVIRAWGFEPKTLGFIWIKTNADGSLYTGNGYHTRSNSEPCLLATRGAPLRIHKDVHQVIMSPVREHSEKPDETHDRIERLLNGPYLELFARKQRRGWDCWGDEVPRAEAAE